ncbi:hypothetical protein ACXR2T_10555 [Leucobacter sp. HY1910]
MTDTDQTAARIPLKQILDEVQAMRADVIRLQEALPHHVAFTKDKQQEYEERLANHGRRLETVEKRLLLVEAKQRPNTPWYLVVGAIVGIIAAIGGLIAIFTFMSQVSAALN